MEEGNPELARKMMFEMIENQMRDNTPPITKETYTRLKSEGHSHEETMKYIACALTVEIFHAFKHRETFNEERFTKNLKALPELPRDNE